MTQDYIQKELEKFDEMAEKMVISFKQDLNGNDLEQKKFLVDIWAKSYRELKYFLSSSLLGYAEMVENDLKGLMNKSKTERGLGRALANYVIRLTDQSDENVTDLKITANIKNKEAYAEITCPCCGHTEKIGVTKFFDQSNK